MERLALSLLLLTAVASCVILLAMPGAEASPDTITVTSTADSGPGTLRQALLDALNGDTIVFDTSVFPPGSPATITLNSDLPILSTGNVTVDGSGAGVVLHGDFKRMCFDITSSDNVIKGLQTYGCPTSVYIHAAAKNNTIGGTTEAERNVLSSGVRIAGSGTDGNVVQGNYIGTDASGTVPRAGYVSIELGARNNTIERNVISGDTRQSVFIGDPGTEDNTVIGNYIGTNAAGTVAIGTRLNAGVLIWGDCQDNTIGGTSEDERNVISGHQNYGVRIRNGAHGNIVKGNYIGTDASGSGALPNGYGIYIESAGAGVHSNTIGGMAAGDGNVIAYNTGDGVLVYGSEGHGAVDNTINGNFIHSNGSNGVQVDYWATRNTMSGNSIHSNGSKGIENISGGNDELAPPIIDSVGGSASGHTDPKCYPCTVEVFSDSEDEGRIHHGSTTTNDDATGTWTYPGAVTGPNITATITDADGNTSEFSAPVAYSPPVGGIAELPDAAASSAPNYIALAALAGLALVALSAGGWYARRRWVR